jgi:hypothetical protein
VIASDALRMEAQRDAHGRAFGSTRGQREDNIMTSDSTHDYNQEDHEIHPSRSSAMEKTAGRTANPCTPLEEEIEVLEEQIAMLEEGLPRAPGMERAALAKEIAGYRRQLESRQQALSHCRHGDGGSRYDA